MAEFVFGTYRLLVDVEKTRAYYAAHPLPWIGCDCAGCRNFKQAVRYVPEAAREFLSALGLEPEKPGEICFYQGTETTLSGGGWYHICGEILEGAMPEDSHQVFGQWLELGEGFSAAFKSKCDLLPEDFPRPAFQMELNHQLPWLLEEANPYL